MRFVDTRKVRAEEVGGVGTAAHGAGPGGVSPRAPEGADAGERLRLRGIRAPLREGALVVSRQERGSEQESRVEAWAR